MLATANPIVLTINGHTVTVASGLSVMAALNASGVVLTRRSVTGEPRSAYCGMGVCQECRIRINGLRQLACQTPVANAMVVWTDAEDVQP